MSSGRQRQVAKTSAVAASRRLATCPGCRMQVALLEGSDRPRFALHKVPVGGFCAEGGKPVPADSLQVGPTPPAAHFKRQIERYTSENLALFDQVRGATELATNAEAIVLRCVQREHTGRRGGLCRDCTDTLKADLLEMLRILRQHPRSNTESSTAT